MPTSISLAPRFGFDPANNWAYRKKVLANLSAERLLLIYVNSGMEGVAKEIERLAFKIK